MPALSFVAHFRNVSLILDCVSCEKCKLWGKLQILGIGTALKVLMSEAAGAAYDLERYADSRPNCPKKLLGYFLGALSDGTSGKLGRISVSLSRINLT